MNGTDGPGIQRDGERTDISPARIRGGGCFLLAHITSQARRVRANRSGFDFHHLGAGDGENTFHRYGNHGLGFFMGRGGAAGILNLRGGRSRFAGGLFLE